MTDRNMINPMLDQIEPLQSMFKPNQYLMMMPPNSHTRHILKGFAFNKHKTLCNTDIFQSGGNVEIVSPATHKHVCKNCITVARRSIKS